eukprot:488248-Prymnesium_polylepis.2
MHRPFTFRHVERESAPGTLLSQVRPSRGKPNGKPHALHHERVSQRLSERCSPKRSLPMAPLSQTPAPSKAFSKAPSQGLSQLRPPKGSLP